MRFPAPPPDEVDEALAPDRMLPPPKEKSAQEKKADSIRFSIRFTPAEYAKVQAFSKHHNFVSVTAYCKHMAISGRVIELDLSLISKLIGYYRDEKTLLRQILLAIYKTGKNYHADMVNIQNCIDRMDDMLGQALDMCTNLLHTIRRDGYEDLSDV